MAIETYAHAAFAAAYAEHGTFPVPERAQEACQAAVAEAVAHEDDPGVLRHVGEAGRVEGLIAQLLKRRAALSKRNLAEVRKFMRENAGKLTTGELVDQMAAAAASIVHTESAAQHTVEAQTATQRRREAVTAAALAMLRHGVRTDEDLLASWTELVATAHAEAVAEGITEAKAVANVVAGVERSLLDLPTGTVLLDLDEVYERTLVQLDRLGKTWSGADTWVADEIKGLAGDLGRALADALEQGATRADLLSITRQVLERGAGAEFYLDEALHTAMSEAMLDTYAEAGLQVDYCCVGDAATCDDCEANQAGSPYDPESAPGIPQHGGCRCWYGAAGTVS